MIFYNGTNDPKIDYKKLDLNNSREIGLHCGTEAACNALGYKYINKLDIDCTNACELDFDMTDIWSSMELINLIPIDIFDLDTKKSILNSMREVAGDIDKYKKYSQIIRNAFLDKGFTVIIYKNEVEDPGSKSAIVLTPDVINTLSESMNAKDAWLKQVKYNRKRLKGLPRVGFNPNAGNVEHSMKMFNHMNDIGDLSNNPISGPFGGDVSAPAGDGASMAMGESYTQSFDKLNPHLKLFIEEHIEYIENNDFDALYDMLSDDIAGANELTDLLLAADIDPITHFDRYLPRFYATGLHMKEIKIPRNIYQICDFAFYGCNELEKVDIELGVETIGEEAFADCYSLKEVNLPSSITYLQIGCFSECPSLKNVYYDGTIEQFSKVRLPLIGLINKGSDFDSIQCSDGDFKI